VYGFCNGNAQAALQKYRLRYPERPVLGYRSFITIHRHLGEFGLVRRRNEQGVMIDVELEEDVLDIITRYLTTSIRRISARLGIPNTSVWKIYKKRAFIRIIFADLTI